MIEHNFDQGSPEWLSFKLGKIGGTKLKEVFKSNNLVLVDTLIAEMGSGLHEETYVTPAMQRGTELEPYVRDIFTNINHISLDEVGILQSSDYEFLVCSPDGISPDRTIALEIKCPSTKKHVEYIRTGKVPNDYRYQVLNYFLVNPNLEKCYFVSFDDRYKPKPYFQICINRQDIENDLVTILVELEKFWSKLEKYKTIINS